MVLFDKLSFSQVVGIFQAFKLYCERNVCKHPVAVDTTKESEKVESDMECTLYVNVNEKVSVSEDPSRQMSGKELPR
jgi:hypothetical protein